jgi:hypothetical protein
VNNPKLNKIRQVFMRKNDHAARPRACKDWTLMEGKRFRN